ncbi:MAG: DUF748 domain-containing protein [Desulfobacteraceae bacterium]|nr:MAG: DUF748 domain-containing protein [Desulfobacteraceae bacterium]
MRRIKKIAVVIAVLMGIYSLTGFVILPKVLEFVLPSKLTQAFNRPVRVTAVHFNPYTWILSVEGADIREPNGADPFVSFDTLFVNIQADSILKMGLIIDELRLDKPVVHLARLDKTTFNFSDLTAAGEPEKTEPEAPAKPFRFAVRNIALNQGALFFRDAPMKKDHVISDINFALPLISNFEKDAETDAKATFAKVVNDAKMSVDIKTRPFHEPLEATIDLELTGISLPYYFDYVPKGMTTVDIKAGLMDIRSQIHFLQKEKGPQITVQGDVRLSELEILDNAGAPVLTVSEFAIAVAPSRPLENEIKLASVNLKKPALFVNRSKDGVISLATLGPQPADAEAKPTAEAAEPEMVEPEPAQPEAEAADTKPAEASTEAPVQATEAKSSEPAAPSKGFSLAVVKFLLDSGRVVFVDHATLKSQPDAAAQSPEMPSEFSIDNLQVLISDFSIDPDKAAKFDVKTRVNQEGNISASGRFGISPLFVESDFTIADVNLSWAQPYMPDTLKFKIEDGRFSAAGSAVAKTSAEGKMETTVTAKAAVNDLSLEPDTAAKMGRKIPEKRKGNITVDGRVSVFPLTAASDFTVADIDLTWAQPYIPDNIKLSITDGLFSAAGNAVVQTSGEGRVGVAVTGEAAVNDFASVDAQDKNAFMAWKSFSIAGLNLSTDPLSIGMDKVILKQPKHGFVLYGPSVSSVSKIFAAPPPESPVQTEAAEVEPEVSEKKSPPIPITVGEVILQNGDFQFTDKSIDPDFSTRLNLSELRITGLTSQKFKSADVTAEGKIDNHAPIKVQGTINPFKEDLFIDLDCQLDGMELSSLSPYTGKFIGQTIGKGKLTTSVTFKIDREALIIQNQVLLDQFAFGRKVDSPQAIDLPLGLAVSLLKDREGRIDINLPVSGRTDVPEFRILNTVLNALKNFIVKAATSPFDFVSGLVGGGGDLQYIEFNPGDATLNEAGAKKLEAVATLMFDRPGLKLDLTGYADREKDREALAAEMVEQELKAGKMRDQGSSGDFQTRPGEVVLTAEEYTHYLKDLYESKGLSDTNQDGARTEEEMAAQIRAQMSVSDQDLRKLAVERTRQVKAAILQDGRIAADRLFLNVAEALKPQNIKDISASRVELGLK